MLDFASCHVMPDSKTFFAGTSIVCSHLCSSVNNLSEHFPCRMSYVHTLSYIQTLENLQKERMVFLEDEWWYYNGAARQESCQESWQGNSALSTKQHNNKKKA